MLCPDVQQQVGIDVTGIDEMRPRQQALSRESGVQRRRYSRVRNRSRRRYDVGDDVRGIRIAGLGEVRFIADPGRGRLSPKLASVS